MPDTTSFSQYDPLRVLVVDDDVDAARSLCCLLQALGCKTAVTCDGPSGLAVAARFEPQLVIIDMEMPGMKGREVMQHLRLQDLRSLTMAVCFSGQSLPDERRMSQIGGFDAFMVKPVPSAALAQLLAKARALAAGTRTRPLAHEGMQRA